MIDAAAAVAERVLPRLRPDATTVVAIAGPVAVGKSTLAVAVAEAPGSQGLGAEVVSTDGFLLPMDDLVARGIAARKGFPESYDVRALRALLVAVRDTRHRAHAELVPVYSHETYDIVPGAYQPVPPTDVLVLEGVNALSATSGVVDLGVYVDAPVAAIETWYVARFVHLVAEAAPGSFYTHFATLDPGALRDAALAAYRTVNLPNLHEHIGPSRASADLVVEKRADHGVGALVDREGG
jgi:type I pantothenate kinase